MPRKKSTGSDLCAVCKLQVKNNEGLQCQGPCAKWRHYSCLDISACKLQAIKNGELDLKCPCPNCEPPKEDSELWRAPCCRGVPCPSGSLTETIDSGAYVQGTQLTGQEQIVGNSRDSRDLNRKSTEQLHKSLTELECGVNELKSKQEAVQMCFDSVKQMCEAVDNLTKKINEVVDRVKETVEEKETTRESEAKNLRRNSSKSSVTVSGKACYCPSNPGPQDHTTGKF